MRSTLLAENGYAGVALTLDHIHFDPFAPRLRARAARLRSELDALGLDVCGGDRRAIRARPARKHFPTLLSDGRLRRVDLLCTAVDVAVELGAPVVSMWSGVAPAGESRERAWDLLVDGCERVLAHAERSGVTLAFEPEPGMLVETLADYERLKQRLGNPPALGLTLDIGHIICLEPMAVAECVRRGAETLAHVHIEDMRRGVHEHLMFGEGELDLEEALGVLAEVGYNGLVAVELSRHSHAAHETVPAAMRALRTAAARGRAMKELSAALEARARPEGLEWLRETSAAVAADATALRSRFPMVGRKVGREPLDPGADAADVHAWTIDDAARTLLLVAAGAGAEGELAELYRYGDAAERRGILRALPYLDLEDRGLYLVDDAVRTNDTRLIAAALGPYATEHLPDAGYDQAVLKCVFVGVPITGLDGIPARVTPDGARMLGAFVHERVAAGRDVPAEVWIVIDRYPPAEEIAAIERERESEFEDRRAAAERALSYRVQERA